MCGKIVLCVIFMIYFSINDSSVKCLKELSKIPIYANETNNETHKINTLNTKKRLPNKTLEERKMQICIINFGANNTESHDITEATTKLRRRHRRLNVKRPRKQLAYCSMKYISMKNDKITSTSLKFLESTNNVSDEVTVAISGLIDMYGLVQVLNVKNNAQALLYTNETNITITQQNRMENDTIITSTETNEHTIEEGLSAPKSTVSYGLTIAIVIASVILLIGLPICLRRCIKKRKSENTTELQYDYVGVDMVPLYEARNLAAANKRLGPKSFVPNLPARNSRTYDYVPNQLRHESNSQN